MSDLKDILENKKEAVQELERQLGIRFKKKELLLEAMMHKSFSNEVNTSFSNERLEFLGDAVLGLVTGEFLLKHFFEDSEGELAKKKAAMVSEESLAYVAEKLGIEKFLLLGKGAQKEETGRKSNLADFLEAIIGAIYIDRGIRSARKFINENLIKTRASVLKKFFDSKSELQEYSLAKFKLLPKYRVIKVDGPVHSRTYVVTVELNGKILGLGQGKSKKNAEKEAARKALERLFKGG